MLLTPILGIVRWDPTFAVMACKQLRMTGGLPGCAHRRIVITWCRNWIHVQLHVGYGSTKAQKKYRVPAQNFSVQWNGISGAAPLVYRGSACWTMVPPTLLSWKNLGRIPRPLESIGVFSQYLRAQKWECSPWQWNSGTGAPCCGFLDLYIKNY